MERKETLQSVQKDMTDISAVDRAATWADMLIGREHRGMGDTVDAARARAARKHKLPERLLWSLRYRRPKEIGATLYLKIQEAVEAETKTMEAKIAENLKLLEALPAGPARDRMVAQLARFQADRADQTQASEAHPRRRSTD